MLLHLNNLGIKICMYGSVYDQHNFFHQYNIIHDVTQGAVTQLLLCQGSSLIQKWYSFSYYHIGAEAVIPVS